MTNREQTRRDAEEKLAAEFHAIYQAEAKRQGDVRHHDDYGDLAENIKEFDRVLARHVLAELKQADAALVRERVKTHEQRLRAEQAERERDENAEHMILCESRLAKVPALVEALRRIESENECTAELTSSKHHKPCARHVAREALAVWEQE